jgi:hypothetical protein
MSDGSVRIKNVDGEDVLVVKMTKAGNVVEINGELIIKGRGSRAPTADISKELSQGTIEPLDYSDVSEATVNNILKFTTGAGAPAPLRRLSQPETIKSCFGVGDNDGVKDCRDSYNTPTTNRRRGAEAPAPNIRKVNVTGNITTLKLPSGRAVINFNVFDANTSEQDLEVIVEWDSMMDSVPMVFSQLVGPDYLTFKILDITEDKLMGLLISEHESMGVDSCRLLLKID